MTEDKKAETFRGVKAFKLLEDGRLQTGGISGSVKTIFKEGETYSVSDEKEIELCSHGFHFYKTNNACFGAGLFGENTVLHEIIAYGNVISDTEKCVAKTIKIGKKIILELDKNYNSGDYNSGRYNSGDSNSGDWNSGDKNSGDNNSGNRNSGYSNSGNYNSGNNNSGDFNNKNIEFISIFNKPCEVKIWQNTEKPEFLFFDIKDNETYKEAFIRSWKDTTEEDRKLVEKLPNFNWEIFTKITGIAKPIE